VMMDHVDLPGVRRSLVRSVTSRNLAGVGWRSVGNG
jgi:hypothetical protein